MIPAKAGGVAGNRTIPDASSKGNNEYFRAIAL